MATTTTNHGTGIEWTHVPGYKGETWNPVRGCTKISPGCKRCYAETFAERWRGVSGHPYEQGFDLRLVPEKLDEPLRVTAPRAYFVNSMSDLHQDGLYTDEGRALIRRAYNVMIQCPHHLFMVLTKRAGNMVAWLDWDVPPPNVWLGVSVEDRKYGLPRVDLLRKVRAAIRFLSVEPLLEDLGDIDLTGIHWVIVGGESGAGARPLEESWVLRVRDQCAEQGVPFFFKQWGGINKKLRGNMLQGRQHLAFPNVVQSCA